MTNQYLYITYIIVKIFHLRNLLCMIHCKEYLSEIFEKKTTLSTTEL